MHFKSIVEKSYSNRYWRIGFHILFWGLMFLSNYYFNTISFNSFENNGTLYLLALKGTIALTIFYYPFVYYVFPSFFARRKIIAGILLTTLFLVIYAWLESYADKQIINSCGDCVAQLATQNPHYYRFLQIPVINMMLTRLLSFGLIYQLMLLLSLPIAIKLARSYFRQTVQQLQLAKDNLQLEFNFLKSQVNPHFLFNTLNNIYSLVMHDKKQQAASTIARLSGFMRYALYESNEDQIEIEKEIQLLRDYVALEQLRLNETAVTFNYLSDMPGYKIPPLLFIPAIENAFKYAADNEPGSFIKIDIFVADKKMTVKIINMFDPKKRSKQGGIGLANMKKRLLYYYPSAHTYAATTEGTNYSMEVTCLVS
jgi:sensor histidine kinase YesM